MKRSFTFNLSLFVILVCCLTSNPGYGQANKAVYAELGGPGIASFNFDTRFSNEVDGFGGKIGVGGFKIIDDVGAVLFPIALNYLFGKDDRRFFEIGAGATLVSIGDKKDKDEDDDPFNNTFGHLHFGYRLQPADGGFNFRAGITPVFGDGYFIPYYFSLSFGYTF